MIKNAFISILLLCMSIYSANASNPVKSGDNLPKVRISIEKIKMTPISESEAIKAGLIPIVTEQDFIKYDIDDEFKSLSQKLFYYFYKGVYIVQSEGSTTNEKIYYDPKGQEYINNLFEKIKEKNSLAPITEDEAIECGMELLTRQKAADYNLKSEFSSNEEMKNYDSGMGIYLLGSKSNGLVIYFEKDKPYMQATIEVGLRNFEIIVTNISRPHFKNNKERDAWLSEYGFYLKNDSLYKDLSKSTYKLPVSASL